MLAEDQLTVGDDVEDTAASLDEPGFEAELAFDRRGQTGRPGLIISLNAVFDADILHGKISFARECLVSISWHLPRELSRSGPVESTGSAPSSETNRISEPSEKRERGDPAGGLPDRGARSSPPSVPKTLHRRLRRPIPDPTENRLGSRLSAGLATRSRGGTAG